MARTRVSAAARKRRAEEEHRIASGVYAVAKEIAPLVREGSLYWAAPLQYITEQMAPRVCAEHGVPLTNVDNVAGYLLAALNEYVVALVGEFDVAHFEQWIAAQDAQVPEQP